MLILKFIKVAVSVSFVTCAQLMWVSNCTFTFFICMHRKRFMSLNLFNVLSPSTLFWFNKIMSNSSILKSLIYCAQLNYVYCERLPRILICLVFLHLAIELSASCDWPHRQRSCDDLISVCHLPVLPFVT